MGLFAITVVDTLFPLQAPIVRRKSTMKILIADNNVDSRIELKVILEYGGYHVEVATNGEEALEMAMTAPPDMIISDILNPKMDGFRLCREIKSNPALKKIPFVFLISENPNPKHKQLSLSLGAVGYFTNPVQTTSFLKMIHTHIDEYKKGSLAGPDEKELRLSAIVMKHTTEGIMVSDEEGNIQTINTAFTKITGYTRDDIIGKNMKTLYSEKSSPNLYERIWAELQQNGFFQGEISAQRKGGASYLEWLNISAFKDETEKTLQYVAIFSDITKQRKMEKHLLEAQKLESIAQLAGGVAHEFNNLLTPIIGYVDILKGQTLEQPRVQDILSIIQKAAQHAAGLTKNLLSFSRQVPPALRLKSLKDLTLEIEPLLRQTIDQRIKITIASSDNLWPVLIDADQIHQVIVNLCMNARDSIIGPKIERSDFHPLIQIKLTNAYLDQKFCESHADAMTGDFVCLSVTDNGLGIDASVLPHLFEPFFTTKDAGQGTGLGLASSHGIVGRHKGWIGVQTNRGIGTTFEVYLPRFKRIVPGRVIQKDKDQTPVPDPAMTIMIVDDDELVRSLGKEVLENKGYRVLTARDGDQAMEIFKQETGNIEIVILDLTMPRQSGWEVLTNLRLLDPKLKAIISTGHTHPEKSRETKRMQPFTVLPKPFRPSDMEKAVRKVLKTGERQEPNRRQYDTPNFRGNERRSGFERRQGYSNSRKTLEKCRNT